MKNETKNNKTKQKYENENAYIFLVCSRNEWMECAVRYYHPAQSTHIVLLHDSNGKRPRRSESVHGEIKKNITESRELSAVFI